MRFFVALLLGFLSGVIASSVWFISHNQACNKQLTVFHSLDKDSLPAIGTYWEVRSNHNDTTSLYPEDACSRFFIHCNTSNEIIWHDVSAGKGVVRTGSGTINSPYVFTDERSYKNNKQKKSYGIRAIQSPDSQIKITTVNQSGGQTAAQIINNITK